MEDRAAERMLFPNPKLESRAGAPYTSPHSWTEQARRGKGGSNGISPTPNRVPLTPPDAEEEVDLMQLPLKNPRKHSH